MSYSQTAERPVKADLSKKEVIAEIEQLLRSCRDLISKKNREIGDLAQQAYHLAKSIHNTNYMGLARMETALYECTVKNDYLQSIRLCDEAFGMMKGTFKKKYTPYYNLNIGRNYHFLGDSEKAQQYYFNTINALDLKPRKDYYEKKWLAHACYNVFILFNNQGSELSQEGFLNKALAIYQELSDDSGLGNCYNSFAVYHYKNQNYEESLQFLLKAYGLAEKENAESFLSIFSANIGLLYAKTGNIDRSEEYFARAKEIDRRLNSPYHTAHTHSQQGEAYVTTGRYQDAVLEFKQAEKLFDEIHVKKSSGNIYEQLAVTYAYLKDYEQAFIYSQKYADTLKELFNDEKTFAILKARNELELEKKEKETQLLRHKNEQIEKYAHQLEVSNSELRQFAHVASHDLREPLRMVSSYVSLLQRSLKEKLSDDEKDFMYFIMQGTHTMHALISDLLTLSSISFVSKKEKIDLMKVLKSVLTNLASATEEKKPEILFTKLPVVMADEAHMIQLFQNLISNAIKYNTTPHPVIHISCELKKDFYEFSVSDNGIGVPSEFRSKIFLIFQRLHSKEEFSGTGIGLAICKKIVEQMGGKIWVTSNAQGGADFRFLLPAG